MGRGGLPRDRRRGRSRLRGRAPGLLCRPARGIVSWSLRDVASPDLDGLPTARSDQPEREPGPAHPNGIERIDHVVAFSPDLERTVGKPKAAGLDLRRVREGPTAARAQRQAFFRLGEVIRWCIFGSEAMDYPRRELLDHVANRDNIQLLVPRQARGDWKHVFVASDVAESCAISDQTKEQNYNVPLYLFAPDPSEKRQSTFFDRFAGKEKVENIRPEFRDWIDERYHRAYVPEEIFGYIFAVLYAPAYRSHYEDFLRRDFPRIPFPETRDQFEALSGFGWELVEIQLMRRVPPQGLGAPMEQGSNLVEQVRWSEAEQKLWINSKQGFANMPKRVWEFTIGGYQVLDKYLKSRKGRTLSLDEIEQIERIANVLDFTIEQMAKIDVEYVRAFGAQAVGDLSTR